MKMMHDMGRSPCEGCTRVKDPVSCENKRCGAWSTWFLKNWEQLRGYPRRVMDSPDAQVPLREDPCSLCASPRALCRIPCRSRRVWEQAKEGQA